MLVACKPPKKSMCVEKQAHSRQIPGGKLLLWQRLEKLRSHAHNAPVGAEIPALAFEAVGDELGDRLLATREHDLFTGFHAGEELGERCFLAVWIVTVSIGVS
ncbi:MAG TPA: hypothetical protein VK446_11675 [Methylocystis sp.]|nr:hypothetical protein [Methylocystis sp.]